MEGKMFFFERKNAFRQWHVDDLTHPDFASLVIPLYAKA